MAFTSMLRAVRVAHLAALVVLGACSSGSGAANGPTAPPAGLTYATNPAVYVVGTLATPNAPTSTGGVPSSYSVSPALPPGLSLNTVTGVIGGTPTTTAASANYTVTASNALGNTTAILTVSVKATLPPSSLSYATNPAVYTKGTAIAPNVPTFVAGPVALGFSVTPSLPSLPRRS